MQGAQIRADIHQNEKTKKRKHELEQLQHNIALPIIDSDTASPDSEESLQEMLEDLDDNDYYITNEEDWAQRLEEWREMLIQEENAQELTMSNTVGELNNGLLSSYTHPAVDIHAKWPLRNLFIHDLEKPSIYLLDIDYLIIKSYDLYHCPKLLLNNFWFLDRVLDNFGHLSKIVQLSNSQHWFRAPNESSLSLTRTRLNSTRFNLFLDIK